MKESEVAKNEDGEHGMQSPPTPAPCLPTIRGQIPNAGDQLKKAIDTSLYPPAPRDLRPRSLSPNIPRPSPSPRATSAPPSLSCTNLDDRVHLVEEQRGRGLEMPPKNGLPGCSVGGLEGRYYQTSLQPCRPIQQP